MPTFTRRLAVAVPAERLFAWHNHRGAFERLTPPWQPVRLERFEGIRDGQRAVIRLGPGPLALRWVAEHFGFVAGRQFCDRQVRGPFGSWTHAHRMIPKPAPAKAGEPEASVLEDHVEYRLPFAPLSSLASGFARKEIDRLFAYRHRVTREDLARHAAVGLTPQTVAITGSTGVIGEALVAFLTTGGHRVVRLVRARAEVARYAGRADERAAYWNPSTGEIDAAALERVDAVVHLAGASVVALRWSPAKKRRILESRTRGTRLLAETLARLDAPPYTFVSASASGFYGDRGGLRTTEADESGRGFLAEVCRAWEEATAPAADATRVVNLRIGLVLTPGGGLLKTMLPAFRLGLGGTVGGGETYLPWVALDDALYAVLHVLATPALRGPVNLSAPEPVTQRVFTATLGEVLRRPTLVRVPEAAVRAVAGETADELALKSIRMVPAALVNSGFAFAYPDLEPALRHLLGRTP